MTIFDEPSLRRLVTAWERDGLRLVANELRMQIRERDKTFLEEFALRWTADDKSADQRMTVKRKKSPWAMTLNRKHTMNPDTQGHYREFVVVRTDGSSAPGGKHHACDYFVLDWMHDPFALPAALAYADACEATHPALARDLRARVAAHRERESASLRKAR